MLKINRPNLEAVALDVSPTMLKAARDHFANDPNVKVVEHDFNYPLPSDMGYFDAVVSSFAIHHLKHECKRTLYEEIYDILNQTGVFCNLEHVPSPYSTSYALSESYWLYSANRRKVRQVITYGNAAKLAQRDRICRCRLLLEMARDGTSNRIQTIMR